MTIQIDPEFQKLILPLSDDEFNLLEQNIIQDGCRDPLSLWGDGGAIGWARQGIEVISVEPILANTDYCYLNYIGKDGIMLGVKRAIHKNTITNVFSLWGVDPLNFEWCNFPGGLGFGPITEDKGQRKPRPISFVYFIQGENLVKIGASDNPPERLSEIQKYSPVKLKLLGITDGGVSLEKRLHKQLAKHKSHSEWFYLTEDVWEVIRGYIGEQCFYLLNYRLRQQTPNKPTKSQGIG